MNFGHEKESVTEVNAEACRCSTGETDLDSDGLILLSRQDVTIVTAVTPPTQPRRSYDQGPDFIDLNSQGESDYYSSTDVSSDESSEDEVVTAIRYYLSLFEPLYPHRD